jgi:hypothetical protein
MDALPTQMWPGASVEVLWPLFAPVFGPISAGGQVEERIGVARPRRRGRGGTPPTWADLG